MYPNIQFLEGIVVYQHCNLETETLGKQKYFYQLLTKKLTNTALNLNGDKGSLALSYSLKSQA